MMNNRDICAMFAAGAYGEAVSRGLDDGAARALSEMACKVAAPIRGSWGEPEGSWMDENKHWVIPLGVGAGAFLVGADAGRNGRLDRGHLSNAWHLLGRRLRSLFRADDPIFDSMTRGYGGVD